MPQLDAGGFFDTLFGHAPEPGWVTLATYPNGVFDPTPGVGPTRETWFRWPDQRADLVVTANMRKDHDLYVCPVLFKDKPGRRSNTDGTETRVGGRRKDNAQWLGVVYADADQAQPSAFKLKPSITVETSPGSHHLYWKVTDNGDVVRLTRSGRAMAYAHPGCDLGGWDITQLLRVPGTHNNKPSLSEGWRVAARSSDLAYTVEEIERVYPTSQAPAQGAELGTESLPIKLPDYALCYAKVSENTRIIDLLNTPGRAPTSTQQGNRSELMWRLIKDLARAGMTKEEAFVLSWPAKANKFRIEGRPRAFWWQQVVKCYEDLHLEQAAEAEDTKSEQIQLRDKAVYLLTPTERAAMPTTWIDRYKAWASTKTDANLGFQEAAAWTVLSCVYGEFGKPATKFDSGNLNLWMMVLGGTTLSRKSTVRGMMLKALRHVSDEVYDYDLGSNATTEGLHGALLDRPGWSSLFHRDEVHGMNEEASKKSYLAGMQEFLTELYDGLVQGKLRADSTKNAKGASTNFVMYLTGATDHVIDSYKLTDFASGHLARFMYVYAEPPTMNEDNLYIQQAEEPDKDAKVQLTYGAPVDRPYQHLMSELVKGRDFWGSKIERGNQQMVFWEADAWKRFNEIQTRAMLWANEHTHSKALLPTTQRSVISMIKMATLLAMSEQAPRVQMAHLLRAVSFVEDSLTHLTVVLAKLHRTQRSAVLEEIVTEVTMSGSEGISKAPLYKKFAKRLKREAFWLLVTDLIEAGELYVEGSKIKRKE